MLIGIDDISFYTSDYYLPLSSLAQYKGENKEKYYRGLGQYHMGVLPLDEDIVTMAAHAALPILERNPSANIQTLLFATESGIDQSKAAGLYVHNLLALSSSMRVVELKQACYSMTAALQIACALIHREPQKSILIIASDVSKYGFNTPGEATQGCGAVAMLIKTNPCLLAIDSFYGCYSEEVMDFWRPNYMDTACVDGKYSAKIYLQSLERSWQNYRTSGGHSYEKFSHFCYHLPFTTMGEKAQKKLALLNHDTRHDDEMMELLKPTFFYNRYIGNTYSASLYISLLSLLENNLKDLSDQKIGLFSYGSGSVGEFFSMTVQPDYQKYLRRPEHLKLLERRQEITYKQYHSLYSYQWPQKDTTTILPHQTSGRYRLEKIVHHKRIYLKV